MNRYLDIAPEVQQAVAEGRPVVALESTIISHGMPYPQNVETALNVEKIIRENGAVPATIAIIGGRLKAGLTPQEIDYLGKSGHAVTKASRRDLPVLVAEGRDGATTVTTTMMIAHMAAPAGITGQGRAESLRVELMELDARKKPVGTGRFETIPVSAVISAVGQKIDLGGMQDIATGGGGRVTVSLPSCQTSVPDVFAGGDVVTGPAFVIDAIAAGKEGAVSIHRYVHPGTISPWIPPPRPFPLPISSPPPGSTPPAALRQRPGRPSGTCAAPSPRSS